MIWRYLWKIVTAGKETRATERRPAEKGQSTGSLPRTRAVNRSAHCCSALALSWRLTLKEMNSASTRCRTWTHTHTHRRPGNDKVNKCCKGKQDVNASNIYFKFNMALTVAASCTGPSFCFPFICSIGLFASAFAIVCPLSRSVLLCVLSLLCLITLLNKSPGQVGSLD